MRSQTDVLVVGAGPNGLAAAVILAAAAVGQVSMYRMVARPAPKWDPYRTPLGNVFLCSSATPPGPGVHGMSGMHAAERILKQHFGIEELPDLASSGEAVAW